jgi:acyl-CoA thioesterase-1
MISVLFCLLAMTSPKKILILGDSISDGYGVEADASYPVLLEKQLRTQDIQAQIVNGSISGSLSSSGPSRLKWQLKSKPDIVILQLGGNDALKGTPPQTIKENLRKTIQLAKQNQIQVLLAGMKIFQNYGTPYATSFEGIFSELSREEKIPLIPFILDGVGGKKELNLPDGIHPNEKGHSIITQTVYKHLRPLL